eukprot:Selendium_serpulae@DN6512_c1_g3_i1.p1
MGRKTWQSLPAQFRPLPDRFNAVVSKSWTQSDLHGGPQQTKGVKVFPRVGAALEDCATKYPNVFIIGMSVTPFRCERLFAESLQVAAFWFLNLRRSLTLRCIPTGTCDSQKQLFLETKRTARRCSWQRTQQ